MTALALRPVARLLPPEDWATKTPEFARIDPEHGIVIVVEDGGPGGTILAKWSAFTVAHVEGLDIDPVAAGHAGVGRALLALMVETLHGRGVKEVLTQADTPAVAELIVKAGGSPVPGQTYVMPLGGA
jgi:hypothetical protein